MAKKKATEVKPKVVEFVPGDEVKFELNGEWVDATVKAVSVVGDEGVKKYTVHHSKKVLTQYVPQDKLLPADAPTPAPAEPAAPAAPEAPAEPAPAEAPAPADASAEENATEDASETPADESAEAAPASN